MNQRQTQDGRIILHDATWHQSGEHLPQMAPRHVAPLPVGVPGNAFTEYDYKQLVIKVSNLMLSPLQSLRVLEQYKRVYLIEFVPHFTADPILPVASVGLGEEHDAAFRRLSDLVISWDPAYTNQRHWYTECKHFAKPCLMAAFKRLRNDEAEYYAREMLYTMANPDRRNLNKPAARLVR